MSSQAPRFKLAICGGGISGLTLAVTLGQHSNIPIDVYESASEIGTIGAGLIVWKRTWDIMCKLGLDAEMDKRSIVRPSEGESVGMILRRSDQPEEGSEIHRIISSYSPIPLHRAQLVDMLKSRLPVTCTVHTSKTLTSYAVKSDGSYILQFADGTTAETDVLIGADGVRSVVRRVLFEDLAKQGEPRLAPEDIRAAIEPQWSGIMVYRSLIQASKLRSIDPNHPSLTLGAGYSYSGKGKHIIAYAIGHGTLVNFLAFDTDLAGEGKTIQGKWVSDAPKQEVLELYKNWEPCVQTMLQSLDDVTSRWAVHVCSSLPLCVSGNAALIGDAVHAMTTHASAGAGQAMEDAYILGRLLADEMTGKNIVADALKIYQDIRLAVGRNIVAVSRDVGMMYEFNGPDYDGVDREDRDAIKRWGETLYKKWSFQWTGSPEDDWQRARALLGQVVERARTA